MAMLHRNDDPRPRRALSVATALFLLSAPFLGASAAPPPSGSGAAADPAPEAISAALFAGTSPAPPEEAWKAARPLSGVRAGRDALLQKCVLKHVAEWVRVSCPETGRVDLLAGEARDLTLFVSREAKGGSYGDDLVAQLSMRPGDRRVLQWLVPDLWWSVWQGEDGPMASGITVIGPMVGVVVQIDWASGGEPVISMF